MPYPVSPVNWLIFYNLLRNFLDNVYDRTVPDNRPTLYLHVIVYSPLPVVLHHLYRFSIYEMFLFNTPAELYLGDVAALQRSHMIGLLPFESTIEQTTETMPLSLTQ